MGSGRGGGILNGRVKGLAPRAYCSSPRGQKWSGFARMQGFQRVEVICVAGEKDAKALEMLKEGKSVEQVRDALGYRTVETAMKGVRRALSDARRCKSIEVERDLELSRLDDLYRMAYRMAKESMTAVDISLCLSIGEQRMRLLAQPEPSRGDTIGEAFEATVEALPDDARDAAAIAAGRALAAQIDYAVVHLTGQDVTKALYLMPHLLNVLDRLGATPKARADIASKLPAKDVEDKATKSDEDDLMRELNAYMAQFG